MLHFFESTKEVHICKTLLLLVTCACYEHGQYEQYSKDQVAFNYTLFGKYMCVAIPPAYGIRCVMSEFETGELP
jgi:hypothetical protein